MSEAMQRGMTPGADSFDDGLSDSEWEDSEGDVTQIFPEAEVLWFRSPLHGLEADQEALQRGRNRERSVVTALTPFQSLLAHDSGLGNENEEAEDAPTLIADGRRDIQRARQMSLRRLGKENIRLVHHRSSVGTPRDSLRSNDSAVPSPVAELLKPFPSVRVNEPSSGTSQSISFQDRHGRNTSESMIADSIIDAHVMTMRALEPLSLSPSGSISNPQDRLSTYGTNAIDVTKIPSLSNDHHITLSPSSISDQDRPSYLLSHFIKTPYLLTAKKKFPRPRTRPRHSGIDIVGGGGTSEFMRLDSGYGEDVKKEYTDRKGKHVLVLVASEGEYDLRSRLERNEESRGIIRSHAQPTKEDRESIVIWLCLQRPLLGKEVGWGTSNRALVRIDVPSDLTTSDKEFKTKDHRH